MPQALYIYGVMVVILLVLTLIFNLQNIIQVFKLLLVPPLCIFLLGMSTIFFPWIGAHETQITYGFYVFGLLIALWIIFPIVQNIKVKLQTSQREKNLEDFIAWQIAKAKENNISLDGFVINETGTFIDPKTGEPLIK